ncbi:MAG: DUF4105 domain-containing protein [Proteobacteria bacterium]|nr:DUF4105 domain-containing protein [Pseudomonadota bacterium]
MRQIRVYLCVLILGLAVSVGAQASVFDTAGEDLEVSLVTYGPGSIYWERFGHDAIRLHDRVSDQSVDFNYGVFDFEDGDFMWNFMRGYMSYMIDAEHSDIAQQDYIDAGRSVLEQRLGLSAAQAEQLRAFLVWNLQPENVSYAYDYLTNNCATRVRDALDSVVAGAIRTALIARPAPMTYRQQIDRLMAPQRWLMLGMDLGLGPSADRPLNEWQESFLPMVLAREIRTIRIPDGRGGTRPLVVGERQIAPNRLVPPSPNPPDLNWPFGITGLALAIVMLASRVRYPFLYSSSRAIYLVLAGVVGTILLALWTLTIHHAAWGNANLLVFNPLAFLILVAAWRARRGDKALRLARTLAAIQASAAILGVGMYFLLGAQQNLPWLLLAAPPWLAIAAGLWQGLPKK